MTTKTKDGYLSAKKLGITPRQRKYLIQAAEILQHMQFGRYIPIKNDGKFKFNMAITLESNDDVIHKNCKTVGCIAGLGNLLAKIAGEKSYPFGYIYEYSRTDYKKSNHLNDLFFPRVIPGSWREIHPRVAAETTLHYLRTGEVKFPQNWWEYNKKGIEHAD